MRQWSPADQPQSSMDAIAQGTREGIELLVNVTAMLIVAVALVALANMILAALGAPFGLTLTLQQMLGWVFAPLAWLIGVPWSEAGTAGGLLGVKTILNEFIAYLEMAQLPAGALSERSRLVMTYALCGFANLGSLGIMVGGLDRDGARTPRRDRRAGHQDGSLGHPRHPDDGGRGRVADAGVRRQSRCLANARSP